MNLERRHVAQDGIAVGNGNDVEPWSQLPSSESGLHSPSHSAMHKAQLHQQHRRRRTCLLTWALLSMFSLPTALYINYTVFTLHPSPKPLSPQVTGKVIKGAESSRILADPPFGSWAEYASVRRAEQALHSGSRRSFKQIGRMSDYLLKAKTGPHPIKLKYPVLWSGAIFSRSGLGTEAVSYVASLLQLGLVSPADVWVSQSGDYPHKEVIDTMDPGLVHLFQQHHYSNVSQWLPHSLAARPLIVVCHSFLDCWRTPADDDTRPNVRKVLKSLSNFFKYTVARKERRYDGCPCPAADIQHQVVYKVGRTMFETEVLPLPLAPLAQHMHEVWVPSEFNRDSFSAAGIDKSKLFTLAQGVNTTLFNPDTQPPMDLDKLEGSLVAGRPWGGGRVHAYERARQRNTKAKRTIKAASILPSAGKQQQQEFKGGGRRGLFRFLSVFKWETRKGWDILLRAYVEEFKGEHNVELHIITKQAFEKVNDFKSYFQQVVGPVLHVSSDEDWAALPRIILHSDHIPDSAYPQVYAAVDALVLPTHGEGWGRPQIEAMAMGVPVISTNWSGLTAFMNDKVAYPIRVASIVDVQDEGPNSYEWFVGQRWAQPDEQHLRQLMRHVFVNRTAAAAKGTAGREWVLQEFSDRAVAQQLLAHLLRLQDLVDNLLWSDAAPARSAKKQHVRPGN